MRKVRNIISSICFLLSFLISPTHGQTSKKIAERLEMHVNNLESNKDLFSDKNFPPQEAPTFNERSSRGIFIPIIAGYLIKKGAQVIQHLIDDKKNKYIAQYSFAETDHYFYDQISTAGSFDPVGLKFKGFTVLRIRNNEKEQDDTVLYAKFIIDTTEGKCMEMMNNGIFRLRLDSILFSQTRIKASKKARKLNLDFQINFTTSYRGDNGELHTNTPLGKFIYTLRNAPLYGQDEESRQYYDAINHKKPSLTGQCFLVPRSSGFYKTNNGVVQPCWGMGLFSIDVSVKETSKMKFIDKVIILSSDPAMSIIPAALQKKYASGTTTTPAKPVTTTPAQPVKN